MMRKGLIRDGSCFGPKLLSVDLVYNIISKIIPARHGAAKMLFRNIDAALQSQRTKLRCGLSMQRNAMGAFSVLGQQLRRKGTYAGMSAAAGAMYIWASDAHAMDGKNDVSVNPGESSGILEEELHTFWMLAKRFQLPLILLLMVMLGWRHPITLLVNVLLLLSCSRPSPHSVYMFIEELRMREMRLSPGLSKLKLFYVRKVDVHDFKLVCMANVELKERKLVLVGILGSWWILQSLETNGS